MCLPHSVPTTIPSTTFQVHTSLLFDPKEKVFAKNISIEVNPGTGEIVAVTKRPSESFNINDGDIDLTGKVVLPGLVDSHTHIFIHSYEERNGTQQMRDQSAVERIVRATNHARAALLAGYTTYRDLGTEALGNADANLRDCINRGLTPGPRLLVATDALASSGSYELRVENKLGGNGLGLSVPRACDVADGVDGVRAAVRRRVGDGADLIKVYADYRRKTMRFPPDVPGPGGQVLFPPKRRNPAVPLYSKEEMEAIVKEAQLAEIPVAAHAGETKAALWAAEAGVTTIEHIFEDSAGLEQALFHRMKEKKTIWVPTLATAEALPADMFQSCKLRVKKAYDYGVRLAAGGDTGTFNHGLNAREVEILIQCGVSVEDALEAATVAGWEACGGDLSGFRFGWFEKGNRADIIALETDPRSDEKALRKVSFVMKDGRVWKRDGFAVDMISVPQWPDDDGNTSEGWSDLGAGTPPKMYMSVPLPVFRGRNQSS
ncbi:putative Xaa-Pro dipeptide hydrolase [Triangularia verruculosa]|uniref:Xaa-Pro dipeptide hydrolase n=1 Tax=Triangularia verruculosa TaxID=2587418 RepID=A0AAN6XJ92_9PEZI|nr:putative Xaa-Pro dipeptide hydrolase [Triangularia verruculosa]